MYKGKIIDFQFNHLDPKVLSDITIIVEILNSIEYHTKYLEKMEGTIEELCQKFGFTIEDGVISNYLVNNFIGRVCNISKDDDEKFYFNSFIE